MLQMRADAIFKSVHKSQGAGIRSGEKSAGRTHRQWAAAILQKGCERDAVQPHGKARYFHLPTPSAVNRAALGQRESAGSSRSRTRRYSPGSARRRPNQCATGTVTALPTNDHRTDFRAISSAGFVQSSGNPWSLSASRISGVMTRPSGIKIAGGAGMPTEDPTFRVGTAFGAQPRPRVPSVQ